MYVDIQFYTVTAVLVALCAGTVAMRDKGVPVCLLRAVLTFATLALFANTALLVVALADGARAMPRPIPIVLCGSAFMHFTLVLTVFLALLSAFSIRGREEERSVSDIIEAADN